jgi:hypothetical protein
LLRATYLRATLSRLLLGLPLLSLRLRLLPLLLWLAPLLLIRLAPLLLLGLSPLLLLRLMLLFAKVGHWSPVYATRHRSTSAVNPLLLPHLILVDTRRLWILNRSRSLPRRRLCTTTGLLLLIGSLPRRRLCTTTGLLLLIGSLPRPGLCTTTGLLLSATWVVAGG